jgi:hypothetical protein
MDMIISSCLDLLTKQFPSEAEQKRSYSYTSSPDDLPLLGLTQSNDEAGGPRFPVASNQAARFTHTKTTLDDHKEGWGYLCELFHLNLHEQQAVP